MSPRAERARPVWLPFVSGLVAVLLRALGATWRVRVLGGDPLAGPRGERPLVGALWHECVFLAAHFYRDRGIAVLVSRSRDGDAIEAVLSRLGFAPSARGSSSRGGAVALREQVGIVLGGRVGAILIDGPRGPARRAKPGVLRLAQQAGALIHPVILRARPAFRFGSWDRTILPAPFARVVVVYGTPVAPPPEGAEDAAYDAAVATLERELAAAEVVAEHALGRGPARLRTDRA